MNINDYIRSLSEKDKKTLSQKGLKLTEEVGELAKAILPYDSAHGTNHRFIDKEKILEEISDVHLTNISIAYSLGITDDEIQEMMLKKAEKWNKLQINEEEGTFPLPFEIHITIDFPLHNQTGEYIENYKIDCNAIGVKPIVLDLQLKEGSLKDVMTSSKHFGNNRTAYEEAERISKELEERGYTVLRKKIESVPWHPAAPKVQTGQEIPNGCYFESHIGVVIYPEQKEDLEKFVDGLNNGCTEAGRIELNGRAKLSQNFFKRSKDGSKYVNMITYRDTMGSRKSFERDVEAIKNSLNSCDFEFEKVVSEYSIYDTNVTHDHKWLLG